ncbi:hypothetical protein CLG96_12300 [Sphingomonas oleivorans]|uniref:Uncharacterized protein n=2 Tax=Sphingomonas oleivorans TaxID=1735121 RepID=A0A2T5FVX6_9SPHN|nr:hypothetical protein CLG96_12300 [Sphingomonas oleivorans]
MQATTLWIMAGLAAASALAAALAERRRHARRDLDRVGWVPWPAVQLAALFVAVLLVVLALHGD